MRRLNNFRSGDRAEALGMVLLQAFCAVAPVPRQEDFGLADAVATLLRRDGIFVHAEDSFLVQFKSRTETTLSYVGAAFEALCAQELSVYVARVDLRQASIELHSLGRGFAHGNFNDAKALIAHLDGYPSCELVDDVLHLPLVVPILRWSASDLEDSEFVEVAYRTLKQHLAIERWNRSQRKSGVSRQIRWATNAPPVEIGQTLLLNPDREAEALRTVIPSVRLLAKMTTFDNAELRRPTRAILDWLSKRGVEADPDHALRTLLGAADARDRMRTSLARNASADVAITFELVRWSASSLDFWLHSAARNGPSNDRRWSDTFEALGEKGFIANVNIEGTTATITIGLTDSWLKERGLAELLIPEEEPPSGNLFDRVFLFRRLGPEEDDSSSLEPGADPTTA